MRTDSDTFGAVAFVLTVGLALVSVIGECSQ